MKETKESKILLYLENAIDGDFLNREAVKFAWRRVHHTLQQSIIRMLVIPILECLAEDCENRVYDDRNEASAMFAKKVKDSGALDGSFPYI